MEERSKPSALLRLTAVVIFLAVCAYAAAWLANGLGGAERTVKVRRMDVVESAEISGVAVRREETLLSPIPAEDGERLSAAESGLSGSAAVFSRCDGYEYLSPDALPAALSVGAVRELLRAEPQKSGEYGRAVFGFEWFFAAIAAESVPLGVGQECEVRFEGFDGSVPAAVVRLGGAENGERAVLLRLTADTPELLGLRRADAEIIFSRYSGLELPRDAVHTDAGGNNFVYTVTVGVVEARNVDIIYTYKNSSGEYCLAAQEQSYTALREGDTLVIERPGAETDKEGTADP